MTVHDLVPAAQMAALAQSTLGPYILSHPQFLSMLCDLLSRLSVMPPERDIEEIADFGAFMFAAGQMHTQNAV